MELAPNDVRRIAALVRKLGLVKASAKLGLHHATVIRLARGEQVRPGTVALARLKLRSIPTRAATGRTTTHESETA